MKRRRMTKTRGANWLDYAGDSFNHNDDRLTYEIPHNLRFSSTQTSQIRTKISLNLYYKSRNSRCGFFYKFEFYEKVTPHFYTSLFVSCSNNSGKIIWSDEFNYTGRPELQQMAPSSYTSK